MKAPEVVLGDEMPPDAHIREDVPFVADGLGKTDTIPSQRNEKRLLEDSVRLVAHSSVVVRRGFGFGCILPSASWAFFPFFR